MYMFQALIHVESLAHILLRKGYIHAGHYFHRIMGFVKNNGA